MAVAGGVGFVKSVTREHGDLIENLVGQFLADVIGFLAANDEFRPLFLHLDRVLLPHRTA